MNNIIYGMNKNQFNLPSVVIATCTALDYNLYYIVIDTDFDEIIGTFSKLDDASKAMKR